VIGMPMVTTKYIGLLNTGLCRSITIIAQEGQFVQHTNTTPTTTETEIQLPVSAPN
jgi:hypothetical protein